MTIAFQEYQQRIAAGIPRLNRSAPLPDSLVSASTAVRLAIVDGPTWIVMPGYAAARLGGPKRAWTGRSIPLQVLHWDHDAAPFAASLTSRPAAWICWPRSRTLVKIFDIPTRIAAEIDSMLPHLIARELPLAPSELTWTWHGRPIDPVGTRVSVHMARTSDLSAAAVASGLTEEQVAGYLLESTIWAELVSWPPTDPTTHATETDLINTGETSECIDFSTGHYRYRLKIQDAVIAEDVFRMQEDGPRCEPPSSEEPSQSRTIDPTVPTSQLDWATFFQAAYSALEAGHGLLVPPPSSRHQRRAWLRLAAARSLCAVGIAVAVCLLFVGAEILGLQRQLVGLREARASTADAVARLEERRAALVSAATAGRRADPFLDSIPVLGTRTPTSVRYVSLQYGGAGGFQVSGTAPNFKDVLATADSLRADARVTAVQVRRILSVANPPPPHVQFEIDVSFRATPDGVRSYQ